MSSPILDTYNLENLQKDNRIDASMFLPFLITRLQPHATETQTAHLTVQLINIEGNSPASRSLQVQWTEKHVPILHATFQSKTITEFAACGMACIVIPLYTRKKVLRVAQVGDSFDYWVGDEEAELALEVSGTLEGNLAHLQTEKQRQLRRNPYGVDGFISLTRFTSGESLLAFYPYMEAET